MPLPILTPEVFEHKFVSNEQTIQYRKLLVKEQKQLMVAIEGKDSNKILKTIKEVISSCIVTPGILVGGLPTFEMDFLFVKIRMRSSENGMIDVEIAGASEKVQVNLAAVTCSGVVNTKPVPITDKISIVLTPPTLDMMRNGGISGRTQSEITFSLIPECITEIVENGKSFKSKDFTKKEMAEFLDSFDSQQFEKITDWINELPKCKVDVSYIDVNSQPVAKTLVGVQEIFGGIQKESSS